MPQLFFERSLFEYRQGKWNRSTFLHWEHWYSSMFNILIDACHNFKCIEVLASKISRYFFMWGCVAQRKHFGIPPSSPGFESQLCQDFYHYISLCSIEIEPRNGFHKCGDDQSYVQQKGTHCVKLTSRIYPNLLKSTGSLAKFYKRLGNNLI